jgi:hypothetical protein
MAQHHVPRRNRKYQIHAPQVLIPQILGTHLPAATRPAIGDIHAQSVTRDASEHDLPEANVTCAASDANVRAGSDARAVGSGILQVLHGTRGVLPVDVQDFCETSAARMEDLPSGTN